MNDNSIMTGETEWPLFIMAHGAGAGSDSDFMQQMAGLLAERKIATLRFDFPYMQRIKTEGKRRPPDKVPALIEDYCSRIEQVGRACVIGGKSMGGRVASLIAANAPAQVKGCACLGYPFHPAGKPDKLRTDHLMTISTPLLIVQGTRDALGNKEEVAGYNLPENIQWLWLAEGDHDLKPRKASGFTHSQHLQSAADAIAEFVRCCLRSEV